MAAAAQLLQLFQTGAAHTEGRGKQWQGSSLDIGTGWGCRTNFEKIRVRHSIIRMSGTVATFLEDLAYNCRTNIYRGAKNCDEGTTYNLDQLDVAKPPAKCPKCRRMWPH